MTKLSLSDILPKKDEYMPLSYPVNIMVNIKMKKQLYEIAKKENTTISAVARKIIKKGLSEYERERE